MTRLPTANLIITFLFYYASAIAHQTPPFSFRFILVRPSTLFLLRPVPHFVRTGAARFVSSSQVFPLLLRERRLERDRKLITTNIDYRRRAFSPEKQPCARFLGRGIDEMPRLERGNCHDPLLRFARNRSRLPSIFQRVRDEFSETGGNSFNAIRSKCS